MNSETLIHRQVHPSLVVKEDVSSKVFEIASSVFTPTKNDEKKLSVYNGDKFSPKEAFDHFIKSRPSSGSLSLSIKECEDIELGVSEDNNPFDGHSHIDFSGCESNNKIKRKAKTLKYMAVKRGWTFRRN